MKTIQAVLAVLFASLVASAFSFAAEPERHLEIKIAADDEVVSFTADDMEVGDTRQVFTESGKEVLVTREDDGFQLEIDGKEIDVDIPHTGGHHAMMRMHGDGEGKVIVRKFRGEGHGEGGEHGFHYIHCRQGEDCDVEIERFSAADRLLESGVLDDLDEAKRQEILDTLRAMEPHRVHKQVRVTVDEETDEDP